MYCRGITNKNEHCRRLVKNGEYCYQHVDQKISTKSKKSVSSKFEGMVLESEDSVFTKLTDLRPILPSIVGDTTAQTKDPGHYNIVLGTYLDAAHKYYIYEYIGYGGFGNVVAVYNTVDNEHYVAKICTANNSNLALVEANIMYTLSKADTSDKCHFCRLHDHFLIEHVHTCLILSRYGKDLFSHLYEIFTFFSPMIISTIAKQMAECLICLKLNKYVHRDIKLDNILFEADPAYGNYNIRLCDFGLTQHISLVDNLRGTRAYIAPEVYMNMPLSYSVDIWALGCVLYELVTRHVLFKVENKYNNSYEMHLLVIETVLEKKMYIVWNPSKSKLPDTKKQTLFVGDNINCPHSTLSYANRLSQIADTELRDLVLRMLDLNPDKRITPEEILKHKFITRYQK